MGEGVDEDSAFRGKFWHWARLSPCLLARPGFPLPPPAQEASHLG